MSRCVCVEYVYKLVLIMLGAYMVTPGMGKASNIPHFYVNWTKDNERFQAEGGARLSVPVNSNLVIKCPKHSSPQEYYRIYWVSELGQRNCFRPDNDSKLVVDCVPPYHTTEYIQEIKRFTGVPGSKDFQIGKSYFLATFSTGTANGLLNEIGGACEDHRLKLNVTITNGSRPLTPKPSQAPVPTTPRTVMSRSTTQKASLTPTIQSTTSAQISDRPYPTDIPGTSGIPVITVPEKPGGNTGVIDISSAQTLRVSSALVLSLCLSLLHILNLIPYIQR